MMTISGQAVDPKVVDRVRKLLNLARDGGATEAEASLAMERAEAILLDNNLTMALVEAAGSSTGEARLKDEIGNANYRWQRSLMEAIAETCFCHVSVKMEKRPIRYGATRDVAIGYDLIGRVSNVTTARQLYEYLLQTASRLRKEYQASGHSNKEGGIFQEGLADRIQSRIRERHERSLREQRAAAEAQKAAYAASGNGSSLVVVMEDYAAAEREANNDIRHGWPVGTTKKAREERERQHEERMAKHKELVASGIAYEVAWSMVYMGWTQERAEEYEAAAKARRAEPNYSGRSYRYRKSRDERMDEARERRRYTQEWSDGEAAGDNVSLDDQVANKSSQKSIR